MMKKLIYIFVALMILILITACSSKGSNDTSELPQYEETDVVPIVTMTMEDGGKVEIELYPNIARNTVNNFIYLIEQGFYDGLIFHRSEERRVGKESR